MHARSDNVELMSYDNVNDIKDKLFESLCPRYQGDLETSMERLRTDSSCFQNWNTVKSYQCVPEYMPLPQTCKSINIPNTSPPTPRPIYICPSNPSLNIGPSNLPSLCNIKFTRNVTLP